MTVSFATRDNTSGIERYEIRIENNSFSKTDTPVTMTDEPEGERNITVRAYDQAGNHRDGIVQIHIDRTPPKVGIFLINGGLNSTASRDCTLAIEAYDNLSGVSHMCISNDGLTYSFWIPFCGTMNWRLTDGGGEKTVFVKFRDSAGNEAGPAISTIRYEKAKTQISTITIGIILLVTALFMATIMIWRGYLKSKRKKGRKRKKRRASL